MSEQGYNNALGSAVRQVIVTTTMCGSGDSEDDPYREVLTYWDMDGKLLAVHDEYRPKPEGYEAGEYRYGDGPAFEVRVVDGVPCIMVTRDYLTKVFRVLERYGPKSWHALGGPSRTVWDEIDATQGWDKPAPQPRPHSVHDVP